MISGISEGGTPGTSGMAKVLHHYKWLNKLHYCR